jgi:hypothetical protein
MSDITALVLTTGEETTQRAINSVKEQTLKPKEIIIIENVTPFHRALNSGSSKVKTEFFVQVDSDMILDEDCFEQLRKFMKPNTGAVYGDLRDSLIGRTCCVKMYRSKCFDFVQLRDSISPDTDFRDDMIKQGWSASRALRLVGETTNLWHTFGEHKPSYTPQYTYSKYLLEGRRYRYRKKLGALIWHLKRLRDSSHEVSLIAQIAMLHGIFLNEDSDLLKPYSRNLEFDFLEGFLKSKGSFKINRSTALSFSVFRPRKTFKQYFELGTELRKANAFPSLKHCMDALNKTSDEFNWIAKTGLCHGLFSQYYSEERVEKEYKKLSELLSNHTLRVVIKSKLNGYFMSKYIRLSHSFFGDSIKKLLPDIFKRINAGKQSKYKTSSKRERYRSDQLL